ncbi:hypothetical protein FOZ63_016142, partial [Perkinsus olseni]
VKVASGRGSTPSPAASCLFYAERLPEEVSKIKEEILAKRKATAKQWFKPKPKASSVASTIVNTTDQEKARSSSSKSPPCDSQKSGQSDALNQCTEETGTSTTDRSPPRHRTDQQTAKPWLNPPKTLSEALSLTGASSTANDTQALWIYTPSSVEEAARGPPSALISSLNARELYLWLPSGGRCVRCANCNIVPKELATPKYAFTEYGWPAQIVTSKIRCRSCETVFLGTDPIYLKSLPTAVSSAINTRFIIGRQTAVATSLVQRIRVGSLVRREVESYAALTEQQLQRRRLVFATEKRRHKSGLLKFTNPGSASDFDTSPVDAIPSPSRKLTDAVLQWAFIRDYTAHKDSLLREISSYRVSHVISLDHSRKIAKRIEGNKNGQLCSILADHGQILNVVATNSTSTGELEGALRQLKGRVEDGVIVFVDRDCCGSAGSNLRTMIQSAVGAKISLKLDGLHGLFRLIRASNNNHPRYPLFAQKLGSAMYAKNRGDVEALRARKAQSSGPNKVTSEDIRQAVRRVIPPADILLDRLEAVIRCFWELDADSRSLGDEATQFDEQGRPLIGTVGVPLLGSEFWGAWRDLREHVLAGCLSDESVMYRRQATGELRSLRGSSKNESRHSAWLRDFGSITRMNPHVFTARLLWRSVFANRRLNISVTGSDQLPIPLAADECCSEDYQSAAVLDNGSTVVTFGADYLKELDEAAYQRAYEEFLGQEDSEGDGEDSKRAADGEEDGTTVASSWEQLVLQGINEDSETEDDSEEKSGGERRDDEFQEVVGQAKKKRRFARLKGFSATQSVVRLSKWTELVKGTIRDIASKNPRGTADEILVAYRKMVLDEISTALEKGCTPMPFFHICIDDIKTYLKMLHNARAMAPQTVRGAEQLSFVDRELEKTAGISFPEARDSQVINRGSAPGLGPDPITTQDIIVDWEGCNRTKVRRAKRGLPRQQVVAGGGSSSSAHCGNDTVQAHDPTDQNAQDQVSREGVNDEEPPKKRARLHNPICPHCKKPRARGLNDHIFDDGSTYGRCPEAKLSDPAKIAVNKRAEAQKGNFEIVADKRPASYKKKSGKLSEEPGESKQVKQKNCSICGFPQSSEVVLAHKYDDGVRVSHERLTRSDGSLVWYCPVGQNLSISEVEELRREKDSRRKARCEKKNQWKRDDYKRKKQNAANATKAGTA